MKKQKILIIEDEVLIQNVLRWTLLHPENSQWLDDFTVLTAGTAEEAFQLLENEKDISIILLDLVLRNSKEDGLDIIKAIRKNKHFSRIIIIVLTVINDSPTTMQCQEAGADGYLVKSPASLLGIHSAIRKAMFRYKFRQETMKRLESLAKEINFSSHQCFLN